MINPVVLLCSQAGKLTFSDSLELLFVGALCKSWGILMILVNLHFFCNSFFFLMNNTKNVNLQSEHIYHLVSLMKCSSHSLLTVYIYCSSTLLKVSVAFLMLLSSAWDSSGQSNDHSYHILWHCCFSLGCVGGHPSGSMSRLFVALFTLALVANAIFPAFLSLGLTLDILFISNHIPVV